MECKKQKSMQWNIRLQEEIRTNRNGQFVTLSFTDEALNELDKEIQNNIEKSINEINNNHNKYLETKEITGYNLDNDIAKLAVRKYLERYRKENKKSLKHWLVTELGHTNTERIHIHGIIFGNPKQIIKHWKYGRVWIGEYVNESTIQYIVKYIYKTDTDHKYYNPIVMTSPGIGNNYINRSDAQRNKFNGKQTKDTYTTRQGKKISLPTYYKYKIYSEDEKERLWINLLDKEERWVNGTKTDISKDETDYNRVLEHARNINRKLGYGEREINPDDKEYERQKRNIKRYTRLVKENQEVIKGKGRDKEPLQKPKRS
ncbi:MAG: replication initiator protein [Microviridae sp.]|nr:MAG: replication initiator protein [Microviridae sp.]